jgi:hypothetical protein
MADHAFLGAHANIKKDPERCIFTTGIVFPTLT